MNPVVKIPDAPEAHSGTLQGFDYGMKIFIYILIILIVIVLSFVLFSIQESNENSDFEAYSQAVRASYTSTLEDVSYGNASGTVEVFTIDGYDLKAQFDNLPDPGQNGHFEAWIVRPDPPAVTALGAVQGTDNGYVHSFSTQDDLTDYTFYMLTLEYSDSPEKPGDHIVEGRFIEQ
jgi:hypothetical protein